MNQDFDSENEHSNTLEIENVNEERLKKIIQESVDESVKDAFKKYRAPSTRPRILRTIFSLVIVGCLAIVGFNYWQSSHDVEVKQLDEYDLTLENHGIFGFKAVDFEEAILGEATRQQLLIVEEQDVSVSSTTTDAGFLNIKLFSKSQVLIFHGTGEYTVDLTEITKDDISLDEETYEITIKIPHAQLHSTVFDPDKTEISDTNKGWLAFGDISFTAEDTKKIETEALLQLEEALSTDECFEEADRFAKLTAYETYQPIVEKVSPAYKVVIEFQD